MNSTIAEILRANERNVIEFDEDHSYVEYLPREESDTPENRGNIRRDFLTLVIASFIGFFSLSR